MSGVSAALEAARLGRRVVIVDAAPALGGQAVGSIIGTIIGLYTHGERPYQVTHGIADGLIADLTAEGSMALRMLQFSDINVSNIDDSSYIRVVWNFDATRKRVDNIAITAPTPKIMPSIVSDVLSLWRPRLLTAVVKVSGSTSDEQT